MIRERLALLAMVRCMQGDDEKAKAALVELKPLLKKIPRGTSAYERWPELIASSFVLDRPALVEPARELLRVMVEEQEQDGNQLGFLAERTRNAHALAKIASMDAAARAATRPDFRSRYWTSVAHETHQTRGQGNAWPLWSVRDGEAKHYPGHLHDYLYFNVPLRGDFEVECDLTSFNYREARLGYSDIFAMLNWELKKYDVWQDDKFTSSGTIDPPIKDIGEYYHFKIAVKDGLYSAFVNGRKIHEQRLSPEPDPWLAIYIRSWLTGGPAT